MYGHERSLVQKMQGKPFALLGVNSDQSTAIAKQAVTSNNLTWRSWYAGPGGGVIAQRYKLQGWPTLLILDAKGVIRYKHLGGQPPDVLEREINQLLQEAEKGA